VIRSNRVVVVIVVHTFVINWTVSTSWEKM